MYLTQLQQKQRQEGHRFKASMAPEGHRFKASVDPDPHPPLKANFLRPRLLCAV